MVKKIRNIILLILAVLILITGIAMTILYIYRNEVIALFVQEANEYLETPVEVKKIELELWENFPMISFKLEDIKIYESADVTMEYLCDADNMLISFDILNIIFKNYEISTLKVTDATFNIGRGVNGEKNYEFIRTTRKDSVNNQRELNLPNIILEDVRINYIDLQNDVKVYLETERLRNNLKVQGRKLLINLSGLIAKNQIDIKNTSYVKDQLIGLSSEFTYSLDSQMVQFEQTDLKLNGQLYELDGHILTGDSKYIDLNVASVKNNVEAVVAVLPHDVRKKLSEYKSKGKITFKGSIKFDFAIS